MKINTEELEETIQPVKQTDLIYAQTEAQKVVIDSQAQATKRMQEGYTYQQERGFVEILADVSLREIALERIEEFTSTLKKYIL